MFFSNSWVFVHIPRTGGTSFREQAIKKPGIQIAYDRPLTKHNPLWTFSHTFYIRTSYTIVRNPYERYASFWRQLTEIGRAECSFEQFVKHDSFNEQLFFPDAPWDPDIHRWRINLPQVGYLDRNTHWFKYETELKKLESCTGVSFTKTILNKNTNNDYSSLYTDELKQIVYKRFEIDFDLLEYPKQWN